MDNTILGCIIRHDVPQISAENIVRIMTPPGGLLLLVQPGFRLEESFGSCKDGNLKLCDFYTS